MAQGALFYKFSIEGHVPSDHLLRRIDRFVDLSGVRRLLAPCYSATGRPSVDPELMIRTDAYVASSYARKKVEMLFAHLKRILGLDRLRLRAPNGARDEFHLAAMVQKPGASLPNWSPPRA